MKFAVIGDPISHSLSPLMHNANFKALNMRHTYEAIHVPREHFHHIKDIISEKEIDGFNVTIPHKEAIIPYLDVIDDTAKNIGAVNTIAIKQGKWIGYNTDGIGYVTGLKHIYPDIEHAYILILGAGGASKGIAHELIKYVEPKITVANRTAKRFDSWTLDVNKISLETAERHLNQFDIIINTTPVGMSQSKASVVSLSNLSPQTLVSDIVYIPAKTPFLDQAEQNGNPIYNGLDMFILQGAASFNIWTGQTANINTMKQTVINKLKGASSC